MNIDPIDLILKIAAKSVGAGEIPAGTNSGPYVERILKRVGLGKGEPWCCADVTDTGILAFGNIWPLPRTASCQALYEFANKHGLITDTPQRGDIFLIWHGELGRFAHTGFVLQVNEDGTCLTHEGNTTSGPRPGAPKDSREGWVVAEKTRTFKPKDRFINWIALVSVALGE